MAHVRAPPTCARWFGRCTCSVGKRYPAFVPRFYSCSRAGALGALLTATNGGRTSPAAFRRRRWEAGLLWTVGPAQIICVPTRGQRCHHRQLTMRLIFYSAISCLIDRLLFLFLLKVVVVLSCGHTRIIYIVYIHIPGKYSGTQFRGWGQKRRWDRAYLRFMVAYICYIKFGLFLLVSHHDDARPRERSDGFFFFAYRAKKRRHTGVRTGCNYLICPSVCLPVCLSGWMDGWMYA